MVSFENWLQERYLYDLRARNQTILREFLSRITKIETPRILDLGSGLGANFRYLHDRIGGDQYWYFLDNNMELLQRSLGELSSKMNEKIQSNEPFNVGSNSYEINLYHSDISNQSIEDINANIVVANAFFDLISREQFEYLINMLNMDIFYFTINYSGMNFIEETERDRHYIDLYNKHMRREQTFGVAMGSSCANAMNEILNRHHFDTVVGPSDWKIGTDDIPMLNYLLQYMEEAIPEILSEDKLSDFKEWLEMTRDRIEEGNLQIQVKHDDILAIRHKK